MSCLLDQPPFAARDDATFLAEMNALSRWHLDGCAGYRAVWPRWNGAATVEALPYLHVGAFKHRDWRTSGEQVAHQRTLTSSSTSGSASRIALDAKSSALQARSSGAILAELLGAEPRPLVILDDVRALQQRGEVSARVTAALSLRPLASEMHFVVAQGEGAGCVDWAKLVTVCSAQRRILVYGFTWMLWTAWAAASMPPAAREVLAATQVDFVHSGGWKKLESLRVSRDDFDGALLATVGAGSSVLDFYGLVEQVGIIYPLCCAGFRHLPRWAEVLVRDPWTLEPLQGGPGMLQLMNVLAHGAPYHSVLTEDLGRVVAGDCPCGRAGRRFEFLGRVPKAEVRGCANV